ncbi:MAG: triose-phosphate isomerase [bacterium]|nr:triose-phosphate isomerase [bacterium]
MKMKPFIIANWKMKLLPNEQVRLARQVLRMGSVATKSFSLAVSPTLESAALIAPIFKGTPIALCAQNCFWEDRGAYTGEVSPRAIKQLGCSYVLLGHSERRIHFGETSDMIAKKVHAVLRIPGLQPILCIGEPLTVRRAGNHFAFLKKQLSVALRLVSKTNRQRIIIAYEPIWAISTAVQMLGTVGRPITPNDCMKVYTFLKKTLARMLPSSPLTVLYGGSVNADNVCSFVGAGISDGALIGGASVDPFELKKIFLALRTRK